MKDKVDETLVLTLKYLKNYFPHEKIKRIVDILFFSATSHKLKSCLKKETYKMQFNRGKEYTNRFGKFEVNFFFF